MAQSHVAGNIRAELARRNKTQADLAAQLGMQRQNISQRLLGRVPFRLHELQAIADYLKVPLTTLITEDSVGAGAASGDELRAHTPGAAQTQGGDA
ncbi:helix-turn-helix domain-containing protein [Mycobacterium botniense]|uniref:HTH cro/C1-type domain-containing protein n=1 Tax=Mycobacterium botniense TaxID=84962 RepID=A0A7I9XY69_9MYCO|nr:helix-turn-helix transcriptional regulator [Mycobacterium botniense]GFG74751.1 hypothetical protein MBOT_21160 [Mycobacterium botniense]